MNYSAAKFHNVPYSSLYNGMKNYGGKDFQGFGGRQSVILTKDEEQKIVNHISWRANIGYGVN